MILSGQGERYSKTTQAKVLKCADDLGYRVDINARAMKLNRSLLIGVLLNEVNSHFSASFLQGLQSVLKDTDYSPLVFFSGHPDDENLSLERCLDRQVDAMVVNCTAVPGRTARSRFAEKLKQSKIPVVEIFGNILPDITNVDHDNRIGGRDATEYLIAQGHRNIGLLTHKHYDDQLLHHDAWQHFLGYEDAMRAHGLDSMVLAQELSESLEMDPAFLEAGKGALDLVLEHPNRPSALVCYNDLLAYGVIHACRKKKMVVPEEISIIGQGDLALSGIINPALTSVSPHYYEIGLTAGRTLLAKLDGEDVASQTVKPILAHRESTCPPSA